MTIHVRESLSGEVLTRHVTFSALVVAGPSRREGNMPNPPPRARSLRKPPMGESKLREALAYAVAQARIWREHEVRLDNGYRLRWEFEHRIEMTRDLTTVHDHFRSEAGDGPFVEDERDSEQRSHQSMWSEARRRGCHNVIIVHERWREADTFRQDPSLEFRLPRGWEGRLQDIAGNVIHVDLERLRGSANGTVAHEMGHCMGLGHAPFQGQVDAETRIMYRAGINGVQRVMSDSDALLLDAAVDTIRPSDGVIFLSRRLELPQLRRRAHHRRHP